MLRKSHVVLIYVFFAVDVPQIDIQFRKSIYTDCNLSGH